MVDNQKNKEREKDFISYYDDDGETKNQKVFIIERDSSGVRFKTELINEKSTFIPIHRILKIKFAGELE